MRKPKNAEASEAQKATAEVLLDTAERLFARDGIENVSIRQIVIQSGHGNISGAHYHFGTREMLIRTLLERRMQFTDTLRHEELDMLVHSGLDKDIRAITQASIRVLERVIKDCTWGRDYVIVAAQALFSPRIRLDVTLNAQAVTGLERATAMARQALPQLAPSCLVERMQMFRRNGTYEIARWLQDHELNAQTQAQFELLLVNLSELWAAGLAAPGPESAQLNGQTGRPRPG